MLRYNRGPNSCALLKQGSEILLLLELRKEMTHSFLKLEL